MNIDKERENFEKALRRRVPNAMLYRVDTAGDTRVGEYCSDEFEACWRLWQDRAALDAQKDVCTKHQNLPTESTESRLNKGSQAVALDSQKSEIIINLTGDEIRAAAREARNMSGPSDAAQPSDYVLAGAKAMLAKVNAQKAAPSDDDLEVLAEQHLSAHAQFIGAGDVVIEGAVEYARSLLSKYGAQSAPNSPEIRASAGYEGGALKSESKHPIPDQLRQALSKIEDSAPKQSGMEVFTNMRTAVQAYFCSAPVAKGKPKYWTYIVNTAITEHLAR